MQVRDVIPHFLRIYVHGAGGLAQRPADRGRLLCF